MVLRAFYIVSSGVDRSTRDKMIDPAIINTKEHILIVKRSGSAGILSLKQNIPPEITVN